MAERLDMDPGHFSVLYNGKGEIGLDFTVQLHRVFGESLNHLCDDDPDARHYPPGTHPGMYASQDPDPTLMAAEQPTTYAKETPRPRRPRKHR
jgi:hypothetical protein